MQITLDRVNYIYSKGQTGEKQALKEISLVIPENQFIALAGSTGSGKSTLVQVMNGLKQPDTGTVLYDGRSVGNDKKELQKIHCRVGLVFQYPEYQLFEETVLKDAAFGPKNQGLSAGQALERAREALSLVGLSEELYETSPFDLSGGEKRRAAIAGILAMQPEILILDEPTAGLDPMGKERILKLLKKIHEQTRNTTIMVTHNMDEAAEYAERILVMDEGRILMDGEPHQIFSQAQTLEQIGLSVPQAMQICTKLGISGCITLEEAARAIAAAFGPQQ